MSQDAITAFRLLWPRHTAKHVSRRWGRAVVTAKLWLKNGPPEYLLQTILADLDEELEAYEREVVTARAALKASINETKATGAGSASGARHHQGNTAVHQNSAGRE